MKNWLVILIGVFLLGGSAGGLVWGWQYDQRNLGASSIPAPTAPDLAGSSGNLVSIPPYLGFTTSTTTDAALTDGGGVLINSIAVGGQDSVLLSISALGGTATSTFSIRQQFSYDESTWFDVHASSTPVDYVGYGTSTPVSLSPTGISFDPGISTPMAFRFGTNGARFTRFLYLADDLLTDPTDGVQAWIEYVTIEPIVR